MGISPYWIMASTVSYNIVCEYGYQSLFISTSIIDNSIGSSLLV